MRWSSRDAMWLLASFLLGGFVVSSARAQGRSGSAGLSWQVAEWLSRATGAPDARAYAAIAAVPALGQAVVAGGFSHAQQQCRSDVWFLNVTSGAWIGNGVPLPTGPLMGHTLTLFHGLPGLCDEGAGCLLLLGGTRLCGRLGPVAAAQAPAQQQWNQDVWALPLSASRLGQAWVRVDVGGTAAAATRAFHTTTVVLTKGLPGCTAVRGSGELPPRCQALVVVGGLQPGGGDAAAAGGLLEPTADVVTLRWDSNANSRVLVTAAVNKLPTPLFGHSTVMVPAADGGGSAVPALYVVGGLKGWPAGASSLEALRNTDLRQLLHRIAVRCAVLAPESDGWACTPDAAAGSGTPSQADAYAASVLQVAWSAEVATPAAVKAAAPSVDTPPGPPQRYIFAYGGLRELCNNTLGALSAYDTTQRRWLTLNESMVLAYAAMPGNRALSSNKTTLAAPPVLVGAAGVDWAAAAAVVAPLQAAGKGPAAATAGGGAPPLPAAVLLFGGWQAMASDRLLGPLESYAVVDEEATWGWRAQPAGGATTRGQQPVALAGADLLQWWLVAHGMPTPRQGALVAGLDVKMSIGSTSATTASMVLMCGGRVPGVAPPGQSRISLRTIVGHLPGGPQGFNLTALASAYWFSDCWLLDPEGGVLPERLRLLDQTSKRKAQEVFNGTFVEVLSSNTDGGRGTGKLVWEQRMWENPTDKVVMSELVELAGGSLQWRFRRAMVANMPNALVRGLDVGALFSTDQVQPADAASATSCWMRLGAAGTMLSTLELVPCTNQTQGSGCSEPRYRGDVFALHGGLTVSLANVSSAPGLQRTALLQVTNSTCLYHVVQRKWFGPPSWQQQPGSDQTTARYLHSCANKPDMYGLYSMVCYGGLDVGNRPVDDTHLFVAVSDFNQSESSHNGTWLRLVPGDFTPGPRFNMAAFAIDPVADLTLTDPQRTVVKTTYVMVGGLTGSPATGITLRAEEVWMLNLGCLATGGVAGALPVATWTQAYLPASSLSSLPPSSWRLMGAVRQRKSIHMFSWAPTPDAGVSVDGGRDGAAMSAAGSVGSTLSAQSVDMGPCMRTAEPKCLDALDTFQWVARAGLAGDAPAACWAAASNTSLRVVAKGAAPVAVTLMPDALEALYRWTVRVDIRDDDGVSILATPTPGGGVKNDSLSYRVPTILLPTLSASRATRATVTLHSFRWELTSAVATLPAQDGTVEVDMPYVVPVLPAITLPAPPPSPSDLATHRQSMTELSSGLSMVERGLPGARAGGALALSSLPFSMRVFAYVVTPDGRQLARSCVASDGLFLTSTCMGLDRTTDRLYFFVPAAAAPPPRASQWLAAAGDTDVYQVRAELSTQASSGPSLSASGTISASQLRTLAKAAQQGDKHHVGGKRLTSDLPVKLVLTTAAPPPPLVPPNTVMLNIMFDSANGHLPSVPGQQRRWVFYLFTNSDTSSEPVCSASAAYDQLATVPCLGSSASTLGTFLAKLQDEQDSNAVMVSQYMEVVPNMVISLRVNMTAVVLVPFFASIASVAGAPSTLQVQNVSGAKVMVWTTPALEQWDYGITQHNCGVPVALLPPGLPSVGGLSFLAQTSLPGLPGLFIRNQTIPSTASVVMVELPGYMLCAEGTMVVWPPSPTGTFPGQDLAQVFYEPGSTCYWMLINTVGAMLITFNTSQMSRTDYIEVRLSTFGGVVSAPSTIDPSNGNLHSLVIEGANLTIKLRADKTSGIWGRGFSVTWSPAATDSNQPLPMQLIMLIVSTASAGGALLAFVMLWHCCYRPILRSRAQEVAAAAAAAAAAAGGGAHGERPRKHVSKRLLQLLPITEYQAKGVTSLAAPPSPVAAAVGPAPAAGEGTAGATAGAASPAPAGTAGAEQIAAAAAGTGPPSSNASGPRVPPTAAAMANRALPVGPALPPTAAPQPGALDSEQLGVARHLTPHGDVGGSTDGGGSTAVAAAGGGSSAGEVPGEAAGLAETQRSSFVGRLLSLPSYLVAASTATALALPVQDGGGRHVAAAAAFAASAGSRPDAGGAAGSGGAAVAAAAGEPEEEEDEDEEDDGCVGDGLLLPKLPVHPSTMTLEGEEAADPDCCSICLSEYTQGDKLRALPCLHAFHVTCIDQWLARDVVCPLCKRDVVEAAARATDPLVAAMAGVLLRKRDARALAVQQQRLTQQQSPLTTPVAAGGSPPALEMITLRVVSGGGGATSGGGVSTGGGAQVWLQPVMSATPRSGSGGTGAAGGASPAHQTFTVVFLSPTASIQQQQQAPQAAAQAGAGPAPLESPGAQDVGGRARAAGAGGNTASPGDGPWQGAMSPGSPAGGTSHVAQNEGAAGADARPLAPPYPPP